MTELKVNQVQLFDKGYQNRCDTFGCGGRASKYIGRPDAPLNTSYVLCEKCVGELVQSIQEQYPVEPIATGDTQNDDVSDVVVKDEAASDHLSKYDQTDDVELDEEVALEEFEKEVEAARTHAELDKIVTEFGLKDIPTKDDGATIAERKEAILAEAEE